MKHNRLIELASALLLTSPLAAQWQDCRLPDIYNAPFWDNTCQDQIYLGIDYLLWFANQDGISPNSKLNASFIEEQGLNQQDGHLQSDFFKNRWDSGVRASIGYKPQCRTWDILASYTNFTTLNRFERGPATASLGGLGGDTIELIVPNFQLFTIGLFDSATDGSLISKVKSALRLNFNQFDLVLGREFYVACDMRLRPYFGLRGMWINEAIQISALNQFEVSSLITKSNNSLEAKSHFHGFGPTAGFETSIAIFEALDLYGSLGGSLLWGYSKMREPVSVSQTVLNIPTLNGVNDINLSKHTAVFNVDLAIGLKWNEWINCGKNLFTFKFGWEQHMFSNLNQVQNNPSVFTNNFTQFDNNIYRGYLSFTGFIFALSYTY